MALSGNIQKPKTGLFATIPGKLVFGVPGPKGDPGLSDTAKVLLISILKAGTYETNQVAQINALALELGVGVRDTQTPILGVAVLGEMVLGG